MKAIEQLENASKSNSWSHAYLFIGGCEEEIDEIIGFVRKNKEVLPQDVSQVSPEESSGKKGEIKLDQVKELLHEINLTPTGGGRLAIVRNCERLNQSSANILLKSIEEPPKNVTFILFAKTDSVITTIKSRCRKIVLPTIPKNQANEEVAAFFSGSFLEAGRKIDMVLKAEAIEELLYDIIIHLRNELLVKKSEAIIDLLRYTERVRRDIKSNANPKLALECLYLKSKEIYDRE